MAETPGEITGIIGGGGMKLNPVHITVHVRPAEEGKALCAVRAVAKEVLIKQRAGEKSATLVAEHIAHAFESKARA